ncbi:MAG: hypothetical protein FWD48_08835 [Oscillospiraceae bacterium]|nr:hypothetical protein [Oscillospiraceae bacterium]
MRVNRDEVINAAMPVYIEYLTQHSNQQIDIDTDRLFNLIELQTGIKPPDDAEPDSEQLLEDIEYSAMELINAWAKCPELPLYNRIEKIVETFIRFA